MIKESELLFEAGRPTIGEGSFGKVVAARYKPSGSPPEDSGRLVAVKSIKIQLEQGQRRQTQRAIPEAEKANFLKELKALGAMKHINIITLYGVCHHADGAISIVEELADGDLRDAIWAVRQKAPGTTLPRDLQLKYALDIARGVAYMHANGIVHCDLKPDNVLLCKGTAVLCDFGLVLAFNTTLTGRTLIGGAVGTLPYMAPENYESHYLLPDGKMSVPNPWYQKPPSDVYSLGCILYELATGKLPFEDEKWNMIMLINRVVNHDVRPSFDGAKEVDEKLKLLIQSCWEKDPVKRPSAADLVTELSDMYIGPRMPPHPDRLPALRNLVRVAQAHGVRDEWIPSLRNLEAFDVVSSGAAKPSLYLPHSR